MGRCRAHAVVAVASSLPFRSVIRASAVPSVRVALTRCASQRVVSGVFGDRTEKPCMHINRCTDCARGKCRVYRASKCTVEHRHCVAAMHDAKRIIVLFAGLAFDYNAPIANVDEAEIHEHQERRRRERTRQNCGEHFKSTQSLSQGQAGERVFPLNGALTSIMMDPDLGASVKDVLGFVSHLATIVDAEGALVCKARGLQHGGSLWRIISQCSQDGYQARQYSPSMKTYPGAEVGIKQNTVRRANVLQSPLPLLRHRTQTNRVGRGSSAHTIDEGERDLWLMQQLPVPAKACSKFWQQHIYSDLNGQRSYRSDPPFCRLSLYRPQRCAGLRLRRLRYADKRSNVGHKQNNASRKR
jgi:hypothetical protein